jgi:hypothetical protein
VVGEHLPVSFPELLEKPGGPFDVGEEEGDRPPRQLCHREKIFAPFVKSA